MTFSTPKFWYQKRGWQAYGLLPISWLYQFVHKIVQTIKARGAFQSSVPVICVGNAVAGGGGKTPSVIALLTLIKKHKIAANPMVISRGYGVENKKSMRVDVNQHSAKDVGDEPIILAQYAPVMIGTDRQASITLAIEQGADLLLMDDGFFNPSIIKDSKVLVVDRNMDFGNGLTIPAGPLRETLKTILPKTHAIITIGPKFQSDLPVFEAALTVKNPTHDKGDYIAFCGIGFPEKFRATLNKQAYDVIGFHEFPDHHGYSEADIKPLLTEAKSKNARLITTEKDFVKMPAGTKEMVDVLYIDLHFPSAEETNLVTYLKESIKR